MRLDMWLTKNRINQTDFAKIIGMNRANLNLAVNGKTCPCKRHAKSIEKATNGEVTVEELLTKNYRES